MYTYFWYIAVTALVMQHIIIVIIILLFHLHLYLKMLICFTCCFQTKKYIFLFFLLFQAGDKTDTIWILVIMYLMFYFFTLQMVPFTDCFLRCFCSTLFVCDYFLYFMLFMFYVCLVYPLNEINILSLNIDVCYILLLNPQKLLHCCQGVHILCHVALITVFNSMSLK